MSVPTIIPLDTGAAETSAIFSYLRLKAPSAESLPPRSPVYKPTHVSEDVLVHEDWEDAGVHGNVLWDGGLALAKFFSWWDKRDGRVRGSSALELGAGTGVVGLILAKLGADVALTDNEPDVLALMRRNVTANSLGTNASVHHLDWADPTTYFTRTFDLVVAADVLYEGYGGPILAKAFGSHVLPGSHTQAFFAFRRRTEAPLSFFDTMARMGFHLERLEDGAGRCVGDTHGEASNYDGSRFVSLPPDKATEAVQEARFAHNGTIQIFRFCRPAMAKPSSSLVQDQPADRALDGLGVCPAIWRVTAEGVLRGSLLVRSGRELTSPVLQEPLMKGARVAEVEVAGNRLRYRKVSGDGPACGWVTLNVRGTELLIRE